MITVLKPIQVHKEVSDSTLDNDQIQSLNALTLANTVSYDCEVESSSSVEAQELFELLSSPHIEVGYQIVNHEDAMNHVLCTTGHMR